MKRPGYLNDYELEGVVSFREDPVAAAVRADQTTSRHVVDRAHDYQTALAQGNASEIATSKAALRQAWETDVRRHGGKPEDFIPDYQHAEPVVVSYPGFFGTEDNKAMTATKIIAFAVIAFFLWSIFGTLRDPNIA